MNNRIRKWISAIFYFGKSTLYCFKLCPLATLFSVLLYMFFKMSILIVVWVQAEVIALLTSYNDNKFMNYAILLAVFCIFTTSYKFRGYITLPVNTIINNTVTIYCKRRIMQAYLMLPLQTIDTEETNTDIKRAKDKAEDLQGDVMMFADAMAGTLSLTIFTAKILTYKYGFIYIIIIGIMAFSKKVISLIFTEKETELKMRQAIDRRKCDYYFQLQTDRTSSMELKVDGTYAFFRNKWDISNTDTINERLKLNYWLLIRTIFSNVISEMMYFIVLVLLAYQAMHKSLAIDDYIYLTGAIASSAVLLETLVKSLEVAYREGSFFKPLKNFIRIGESYDNQPILHGIQGYNETSPILNIESVSFSYNGCTNVLQEVDFSLNQNEIVALVGPNGGGKSTLMKIALGLLEPISGSVSIKGVDIKNIPSRVRCHVQGVVFQDYLNYKTTLRDSIGFGNIDRINDDEAIKNAMVCGQSDHLLKRADNLDVYLGRDFSEEGLELSGGEWQRVAISRAFMGEHEIMVFDEPSSAIDPFMELQQFQQIQEYLKGKSGVLVTHRVGLCKLANRIVFLDQGRIVEEGTHEELIKYGARYAHMYYEQSKWYDLSMIGGYNR